MGFSFQIIITHFSSELSGFFPAGDQQSVLSWSFLFLEEDID